MRWLSRQDFRRHRAVKQGADCRPLHPRLASLCTVKTLIRVVREILSQNWAEKFHWNPVLYFPRVATFHAARSSSRSTAA